MLLPSSGFLTCVHLLNVKSRYDTATYVVYRSEEDQ
jgi:hypothetical protein